MTSLERENTFEKTVRMVTVMKIIMEAPRQQLWKSPGAWESVETSI
jgi:hypothetical protein